MAVPLIVYGAMAGLRLLSGVQQANNIQRQAELQKKLDQFNIEQAELDAFNAEADGYTQMARYENVINAVESQQRNIYYANDVNPNFGTAADIQADTKLTGQLNLLDIQSQAHQRALGYKKQANNMRGQSGLNQIGASLQATTARNTAIIGALGTVATGLEKGGYFDSEVEPKDLTGGYVKTKGGHFGGPPKTPSRSVWDNVSPYTKEQQYNMAYGGALGRIG